MADPKRRKVRETLPETYRIRREAGARRELEVASFTRTLEQSEVTATCLLGRVSILSLDFSDNIQKLLLVLTLSFRTRCHWHRTEVCAVL